MVHGGFGFDQGFAYRSVEAAIAEVDQSGGDVMDLAAALGRGVFNEDFFSDLRCRRALWQLMLGGVFDRHPGLKVMMTEVRGDWIPATLRRLDALYEEHRADLPGKTATQRVLADQLHGRTVVHAPVRGRDARRDRGRHDQLRP